MIEIVDRLGAAAEAIGVLDELPGSFYVDITIRMHHHAGDGYTNRDLVVAAEKLAQWLDLIPRKRDVESYQYESAAIVGSGRTYVHAYPLASAPAPSTPIDLDI